MGILKVINNNSIKKEHPITIEELDLVEEDDQFTHMIRLDGEYKEEMMLNVFKKDEDFLKNEKQYEDIKCEILGESDADSDSSGLAFYIYLAQFSNLE